MSKISVTTIAGLTSGGDANKVKIDPSNTLHVPGHASVGADIVAGTRALSVAGATDGGSSEILNCFNSSLASKFSVRDDGLVSVAGTLTSSGLITASSGVAIGGTGAANTLDDYEEGTWTANLIGSTGNPSTAVTSSAATYTKIGRLVYARWMIGPANVAGASGGIRVDGLPFNNVGGHVSGNVMLYYRKSAHADAINLTPYISGNQVYFYQTRDGNLDVWAEVLYDLTGASTNFYMYASAVYETAS